MVTHPVLVIGIGRTGCNILSTVSEFVTVEEIGDYFQFLAIDSSSRDLQTFAPDTATTYELTIDREAYNRDYDSVSYLQSEPAFVPEAGTSRRRPLGRYLVDSNADSANLYECLSNEINTLSENHPSSTLLQVWVINSLGGGTGSGAFPLVSLLTQKCSQEIEGTVEIFGIGSLPRLDRLRNQIDVPEGEPAHYANAYTALAELRGLMNLDNETVYPIELDIDSSEASVRATSLSIDQNPFEGYWLLGFNETDQFNTDHVSRMNRVAARLVFYIASTDSNDWFRQGHLYSIASVSVEASTERLQQYHTLNQELDQHDDELGTLRSQRESLITAVGYIDSLLRTSNEFTPDEETQIFRAADSLPFDEALISECEGLLSEISTASEDDRSQKEVFDKLILEIVEEHQGQILDELPSKSAVKFLCGSLLRRQIRQEIATHPLPDYLFKLQNKWLSSEVDEHPQPERMGNVRPQEECFQEWRETILNKLQDRMENLQGRVDDSLIPSFASASGERMAELEADLERADRYATEYEELRELEAHLADEIEKARQELKERRHQLEKKVKNKREEWENTQQRWARLSQQCSQLRDSMKDLTHQEGRVCVPLQLDDNSIDSEICNLNLTSLLERRSLSEQDLRRSLEKAMTLLEEPVEDLAESQFGKTTGQLGIIAADDDHSLLKAILLNGENESDTLQRELYYHFEDIDDIVSGAQGSSLHLLGFYAPVSLQYTSEFGTIHQCYTDPESDVSSLLGSISDADLQGRFAYPELLNHSS